MIELLEKPCFYRAVSGRWDDTLIGPCSEDRSSCPNWDSNFEDARGNWERCAYGKLSVVRKDYVARRVDQLRNYFAKGAMEAIIGKIDVLGIFNEGMLEDITVKESNMLGISKASFKIADLMIEAKFKDIEERKEREKIRKLEVDD